MGWRSWRKDTRRHVGVRFCFRDVSFFMGQFSKREGSLLPPRPSYLSSLSEFEAYTHANNGTPVSLDFGFAYGDIFNHGKPVS